MKLIQAGDLAAALSAGEGALVSLVGGGGKTTLMYRLTGELYRGGVRIAAATTTKIGVPRPNATAELLCAESYEELTAALRATWGRGPRVLGRRVLENGKVEGIPPEWCDRLVSEREVEALVVEADGAAQKPLKAPEAWEPVVPLQTTVFVAVVGLSCLGRPLDEETVFRSRLAALAARVPLGSPVAPEVVARLLSSGAGLLKGRPEGARAVALLNQADGPAQLRAARAVAESVLETVYERTVVATLREPQPVREIWVR